MKVLELQRGQCLCENSIFLLHFTKSNRRELQRNHSVNTVYLHELAFLSPNRFLYWYYSGIAIRVSYGENILGRVWYLCPSNFQEYMNV